MTAVLILLAVAMAATAVAATATLAARRAAQVRDETRRERDDALSAMHEAHRRANPTGVLGELTARRAVVHTFDDRSYRGVITRTAPDGLVIEDAEQLLADDEPLDLSDGGRMLFFVPIANVAKVQRFGNSQ